jgi:hypothetical protein
MRPDQRWMLRRRLRTMASSSSRVVAACLAAVGAEVVPNEHDRGVQGAVRRGDQGGVAGLGHAGPATLAAAVDADPVEPARPVGLQAGHARDRQAVGVAGDPGHGVRPRGAQVQALPGRSDCPA